MEEEINNREKLIVTTAYLMAGKGDDIGTSSAGISTPEIARASGVTQPLIHYHFKRSVKLFEKAFEWLMDNDPEAAHYVESRESKCSKSKIKGML